MAIPILVDIFGHPPFSGYNEEGLQQAQLYNSCVQEVKTKFIIGRFSWESWSRESVLTLQLDQLYHFALGRQ